jgi:chitinase
MRDRRLLVLSLLLTACATAPPPQKSFKVIGYVMPRTNFERIDATKVTHLNYAFAKVRGDDVVYFENDDAPAHLARLRSLKSVNPELKIVLSIGGWGAEWFSDAALTEASRCRFATSAVALMTGNDLDGLDIDWEYPGQPGAGNRFRPEDKRNFTLLLKAVRDELDVVGAARGRHYVLTIASSGGRYFEHTEMDRLHAYLDWINVMTYDFAGGWMSATGHHAQLYASGAVSTEAFVKQHLAAGVPAEKIVVGVPFYGKEWKWVNRKSATGIGEPYDFFAGDLSYAKLQRDYLAAPGFTRGWDPAAHAPYLWNAEVGTFVSYEDPQSLREKARFVRALNLGGVMYWEHSHDPEEILLTALADALAERRRPGGWPGSVLAPRRRDAAEPAGEDAGVPIQ